MPHLALPTLVEELGCPPWCSREYAHDLGEPFRSHWSTPAAVPSGASPWPGGPVTLQWAELARVDAPGAPGSVVVVLNDRTEAPMSATGARALAEALVALADEIEAGR